MAGRGERGGSRGWPVRLLERLGLLALLRAAASGRFGTAHEWISLGLVFATLGVAVWSIEQAEWIDPQPSLVAVLALAVIAGLVVLKGRWSDRLALLLLAGIGLLVTVWHSAALVGSGNEWAWATWWRVVTSLRPNEGTLHFAIFLILVTWAMGVASAWFVLRRRSAWMTVALGSLAVLVNLSNLPREDRYFLPLFAGAALLLLGQVHLAKQGVWSLRSSASLSRRGITYVVSAVGAVSLVTVGTAWIIPEPPVGRVALVSIDASGAQGEWYNIFADVHSKWTRIDSEKQRTLRFSDPLSTSNRLQFVVTADRPAYWRVRRYDTYHSWGWTTGEVTEHEPEGLLGIEPSADGETLAYTVETKLRTDVLLTAGDLLSLDIPFRLQTLATDGPGEEAGSSAAGDPAGAQGTAIANDVMAVVAPRTLRPYRRYDGVAVLNSYSSEELAGAGEEYPEDIAERYLQLPDTLPPRVRVLARTVTAEAENPYEKTVAVLEHVLGLRYNVDAEVPPEGVDAVYHFLFTSREGVCTEFASAAAVLLRSVGVPARINSGYLEGELDPGTGAYNIRIKDYHARAEVYFPGYGWVEFPATPVAGSYDDLVSTGVESVDEFIVDPMLEFLEGGPFGPVNVDPSGGGSRGERGGIPGPSLSVYFAVIGIPVGLILAVRLAVAFVLQRLKRANSAEEVWRRMGQLGALAKLAPLSGETPLEYGARLETAFPEQSRAIATIADCYVETRYSQRRELEALQRSSLQKAWVRFCPALLHQALRSWYRSE